MLEDNNGIVCTCDKDGSGAALTTFRLSKTDWDAITFSTNQLSYYTGMSAGEITVDDVNKLNYFDAFNCNKDADHKFTCTAWQPNWKSDAGKGATDGYPRFGIKETITAGTINAASTDDISWKTIQLVGAELGLAAACVGLAAALGF